MTWKQAFKFIYVSMIMMHICGVRLSYTNLYSGSKKKVNNNNNNKQICHFIFFFKKFFYFFFLHVQRKLFLKSLYFFVQPLHITQDKEKILIYNDY